MIQLCLWLLLCVQPAPKTSFPPTYPPSMLAFFPLQQFTIEEAIIYSGGIYNHPRCGEIPKRKALPEGTK